MAPGPRRLGDFCIVRRRCDFPLLSSSLLPCEELGAPGACKSWRCGDFGVDDRSTPASCPSVKRLDNFGCDNFEDPALDVADENGATVPRLG
jgi:hypothetical protein